MKIMLKVRELWYRIETRKILDKVIENLTQKIWDGRGGKKEWQDNPSQGS